MQGRPLFTGAWERARRWPGPDQEKLDRALVEVLYTHPAVYEAAVIGIPDEVKGEIPKAFITLKPGHQASEGEIIAFCKANLAPYKIPRQVEIRSELPKSSTVKVLHRELRKER